MSAKRFVLAVLAASFLLAGAAGAVTAQPATTPRRPASPGRPTTRPVGRRTS
jgi:hypothetical protein